MTNGTVLAALIGGKRGYPSESDSEELPLAEEPSPQLSLSLLALLLLLLTLKLSLLLWSMEAGTEGRARILSSKPWGKSAAPAFASCSFTSSLTAPLERNWTLPMALTTSSPV